MDKFYQACYTRVGGADRNSGWQLTNTSPDFPAKLLNAFEQRQKGNEPVGRTTPRNVKGEFLCALELSCEADAVSLTRIQYGVPCHGREGLYSHGFLFPNAYELLKDPNRILSLSEENFCFHGDRPDPEQALELYLQRTARIPDALAWGQGWTLERALERTGMKQRSYKEFVCCLYGSWAKSAKTTIYVKTDGTDEMARAMMYLTYVSLPYSMRTKLTASTFPDAKNVTMVLTHELPDGCRYFDPSNGMNNVLTTNQRKRWEKMPFVTMLFDDDGPRFDDLERQLDEMGDRYSQDITTLETACQFSQDGAEANPVDQLYNFLDIRQDFNAMMEQKVARKLDEVSHIITAQGLTVSEDMEQMLNQRLNCAGSEELRSAGYRYKSARLSRMDLDEGCRYLKNNDADFNVLRENLRHTENGLALLTEYYRREIAAVIDGPACTYEALVDCAGLFCDLGSMGELWNMVLLTAKGIAADSCRRAVLQMRTEGAEAGTPTPLYLALKGYTGFAGRISELQRIPASERGDLISALQRSFAAMSEEWVREYDKNFRRSFDPNRMAEYVQFYTKDFTKAATLRYSTMLLQKYLAAEQGELQVLLEFVEGGCVFDTYAADGAGVRRRTRLEPASADERDLIERSLFSHWVDQEKVQNNAWMWTVIKDYNRDPRQKNLRKFQELDEKSYLFWERAARLQNLNMIWLMLQKKSVLVLADGILERSIALNERYWTDERLEMLIGQCDACVRDGKSEAKEVRDILAAERGLRAETARENQKQAQRDQRDREKEAKRTAKQEKKTEKQAAQTEPVRKQPGVANKFTEENPAGYVPFKADPPKKPAPQKKADPDNTDSVLDFLGTGHERKPQPVRDNGESLAPPLPKDEGPAKTEERGRLFGFLKKRRS